MSFQELLLHKQFTQTRAAVYPHPFVLIHSFFAPRQNARDRSSETKGLIPKDHELKRRHPARSFF